ncbi:MAG: PQQ-dependent sugar dehydrogenase [bacterium]|nr:PQQ-dependent sugar dehydrogenase [bacterium]
MGSLPAKGDFMTGRLILLVTTVALALGLTTALRPPAALAREASAVRLDLMVGGEALARALGLVDPGDGSGRLFLPQQSGQIRILDNGVLLPTVFLDISDRISCCESERGLVGLEFHPRFKRNGYLYVVYVSKKSRTVVSRFSVSNNRNAADPASEEEIIRWKQPDLPHNGGAIAFGPDGYLYLGSGDGGTRNSAQELDNLLGAILRIDVDSAFPYAIPEDNPFVGDPDAREEVWVHGLRNPWRFSFDRKTGDLFIGDVGAHLWEEVSYLAGGSPGGANYGWPIKEGPRCLRREEDCADESLVDPIIAYPHDDDEPCDSVTGGFLYRGPAVPTLPGFYIFGDFCRGEIWGARQNQAGNWVVNRLLDTDRLITSFGEDANGNLYVVTFREGVFRLVGQNLFASDFESGDTRGWSQSRGNVVVIGKGLKRSGAALEINAGSVKSFVRSKHPSAEKTFRVGFDLNVNKVNLSDDTAEIFRLASGTQRGHIRLVLEQDGNRYWLHLLARNNSGAFFSLGRTGVPRSRTVRIELDWMAASGPGAGDGQVTLSKNGKPRISAANLDNDRRKIGSATLGLPAGSGGAGTYLVDNYVSTP